MLAALVLAPPLVLAPFLVLEPLVLAALADPPLVLAPAAPPLVLAPSPQEPPQLSWEAHAFSVGARMRGIVVIRAT